MQNSFSNPWPDVCLWCRPMRAAVCLCLLCNSALSKLQSFISFTKSFLVRNHIELWKHLRFDNWLSSVGAFGFENLWKMVLLLLLAVRWKPLRMWPLCGNTGIRAPPLPPWEFNNQDLEHCVFYCCCAVCLVLVKYTLHRSLPDSNPY